jgi:phosphate/sulfate permease
MEKEGYFRIISVAVGRGVAVETVEYFTKIGVSAVISLIISVGIAVIVYELLTYSFLEIPYKSLFFRRLIDPRSRFEGR